MLVGDFYFQDVSKEGEEGGVPMPVSPCCCLFLRTTTVQLKKKVAGSTL